LFEDGSWASRMSMGARLKEFCLGSVEPPPLESPAEPAEPTAAPLSGSRRVQRLRLLVIDDEPVIGSVLRRIFGGSHEVTVAAHGREALAILDTDAGFDVVLCDVVMPELTGPEVYEQVRVRHPRLLERFVFITGGALHEKSQRFLSSIANPVLHKPFDLGALRDTVRRVATA
jgi:two-component system, NtrC family, sensor kinase